MCCVRFMIAASFLLGLDLLWLKYYMGPKYQQMIPKIQGSNMRLNMYSAAGAYALMLLLLWKFVLKYKLSYLEIFVFGFAVYGVYDLTCGAVFKNWDFKLALVDMLWGGFVYMTAVYMTNMIKSK